MDKYEKFALYAAILLILLSYAALSIGNACKANNSSERYQQEPKDICCDISLGKMRDTTKGLIIGLSYHLLEKYAEYAKCSARISIEKNDSADIMVLPYPQSPCDSIFFVPDSDSLTVWATKDKKRVKLMEKFMLEYCASEEHKELRALFFNGYDPYKRARSGKTAKYLSPYDDIIKEYADSIGLDWRLLAAVIYQESRFDITARSRRGALGLMQIIPFSTDGLDEEEDYLNPRTNIRTGSMYLSQNVKRYRKMADNQQEAYKFALASYNAGAGRMKDILNYAKHKGVSTGNWESVSSVMHEMSDSASVAECDTLKFGLFKSGETKSYVSRVMSVYESFKKICP